MNYIYIYKSRFAGITEGTCRRLGTLPNFGSDQKIPKKIKGGHDLSVLAQPPKASEVVALADVATLIKCGFY